MTQTLPANATFSQGLTTAFPVNVPVAILFLGGLFAHSSFVIQEAQWLWNSEHYSFFPLAFLAFGWIAWERLQEHEIVISNRLSLESTLLCIANLGILAIAFLAGSNWMGWVAFLLFLYTCSCILFSRETFASLRGVFAILLLIIPLPLNLDSTLVINLQKVATQQASLLLDFMGVFHSVSGVTVQLPGKEFMIDDACSGIRSLFSAITTMLVFAVYFRYGLIRVVLTLAQTALWVLIVNSLRVFFVVYAFNRWDAGLESGWRHDALGFASYLLMMLFAISTDQFFRYVFPIANRGRRKQEDVAVSRVYIARISQLLSKPFGKQTTNILAIALSVGFVILGMATIARASLLSTAPGPGSFEKDLVFELGEESLPATINGWQRSGFRAVSRDKSDPFGTNSMIWTYTRDGIVAQFSIDGAYSSFHDLWYCYSSIGWELRKSDNHELSAGGNAKSPEIATEYQLFRGSTDEAYVIYSCMDSTGNTVAPPPPAETALRRLLNRLRSGNLLASDQNETTVPPVIQFQVYSNTNSDFSDAEFDELRRFFAEIRAVAKNKIAAANR